MSGCKSAKLEGQTIDWSRRLHDPKHWQQFYDELAIETYGALAGRLSNGHWPQEAVELAVEDISNKMRREGLSENVMRPYRDEYFKHADQLCEVAEEIAEVMSNGDGLYSQPYQAELVS